MQIPTKSFTGRNLREWLIAEIMPTWLARLSIDYDKALRIVTARDLLLGQPSIVRCQFPSSLPLREAIALIEDVYRQFVSPYSTISPDGIAQNLTEMLIQTWDGLNDGQRREKVNEIIKAYDLSPSISTREARNEVRRKKLLGRRPKRRTRKGLPPDAYRWIRKEWDYLHAFKVDERASELFSRYDERRDREGWPPYGANDLKRFAHSATFRSATRHLKK